MAICCGCERSQWAFILGCCILGMLVISLITFVVILALFAEHQKSASNNFGDIVGPGPVGPVGPGGPGKPDGPDWGPPGSRDDHTWGPGGPTLSPVGRSVGRSGGRSYGIKFSKEAETIIYVFFGIAIFFTIVEIGFSVVLILGAKKCSRRMLTIWFIAGIVFAVFHAIFSFAGHFGGTKSGMFLGTGLILLVLYICALVCVWPLRDECEAPGGGPGGEAAKSVASKNSAKK